MDSKSMSVASARGNPNIAASRPSLLRIARAVSISEAREVFNVLGSAQAPHKMLFVQPRRATGRHTVTEDSMSSPLCTGAARTDLCFDRP